MTPRQARNIAAMAVLAWMAVLFVCVLVALAISPARAQSLFVAPIGTVPQPFRLADVCPGFVISTNRGKAEVYIRCPPQTDPWITIKECASPTVQRHTNGKDVDIYCTKPVKA